MKISLTVNSPGNLGGGRVYLELPDDYDVQDLLIEKLLAAKQAGQVAEFISGLDGDSTFHAKMEEQR